MHFFIVITTALIAASSTMAYDLCPAHTYPKCCGVDILGVADLECNSPRENPASFDLFASSCVQQGKEPRCCAIPVGGQALFCVDPLGSRDPSPAAPNNQRPLGGTPASQNPPGNGDPGNGDNSNPPSNGTSSMMTNSSPESSPLCPSLLYSNEQCCSTDVLGVADLDCAVPNSAPKSGKDFNQVCAQTGKQAACCTLPLLGQGVLCIKPVGA